jgi:hypothetical protein
MFFLGKGGSLFPVKIRGGNLAQRLGWNQMAMSQHSPFRWVHPVAPLKLTTINVRAGKDGLERPGEGAAGEVAAAAAWRWWRQLGGSVACAAVVAARRRRRRQRQRGGGSQLGDGGGSLVEARLWRRWQRFGKRGRSARAAAAALPQIHCNYQCAMVLEDVTGLTNLNGHADLYQEGMSKPLHFTLCKLLL